MQSSEKSLNNTSLGLHSRLSRARLLFQGLKKQSEEDESLSPIKQIILSKISPFLDNQTLIPGLSMGLRTVLNQVSDDDVLKFLAELDNMVSDCIDEVLQVKMSTADLDMRDKQIGGNHDIN